MKKECKILTQSLPDTYDGFKWKYKTVSFDVEVMSIVGKYAMVRRKGAFPFVCKASQLSDQ